MSFHNPVSTAQTAYQIPDGRPHLQHRATAPDPSRLAPEDAFAQSPPRRQRGPDASNGAPRIGGRVAPDSRHKGSGSRRRKGMWKKLLWVKQSYPDNYTDEETFLDHLQRNPRLQPYEFWPLVADSTVIIQHVCSVTIFICCFVGISQERMSPITVVGLGSVSTVLGWILWDTWVTREDAAAAAAAAANGGVGETEGTFEEGSGTASSVSSIKENHGLGLMMGESGSLFPRKSHSHSTSGASASSIRIQPSSPVTTGHPTGASSFANYSYYPLYGGTNSFLSTRNQQRLATVKSAILIYCALLGLSPILKSLTRSTSSDSIWALSTWLMCVNVFFFHYDGTPGAKITASLSTNAALMASTVLASRLPSTAHVFSLTLFSIEVFGLFPIFRRHLRHMSWRGHVALTVGLIIGAGGGVGVTISGRGGWKAAVAGVVLGCLLTGLAMGVCSWWLIGLQKYKNEIHGPWDAARPIIRRRWDATWSE